MSARRGYWRNRKADAGDVHVVPTFDLQEHEVTGWCWCKPACVEPATRRQHALWVHNSADGRELVERHGLQ
jgi:hypothetical protein